MDKRNGIKTGGATMKTLKGTIEYDYNQVKADANMKENTFPEDENGKGEDGNGSDRTDENAGEQIQN